MAEEFTTFDEFHQKVDTELILEDVFHINQEWMVYTVEDVLLHSDVVQLVVFNDQILSNTLHGIEVLSRIMLNEEHLSESALTNKFLYLKVLKVSILV